MNELFEVTDVQLYVYFNSDKTGIQFSANYAINNCFMIQLGEDGRFTIPSACEACWNDKESQDIAAKTIDADNLAIELELPTTLAEIKDKFSPDYYGDKDAIELANKEL